MKNDVAITGTVQSGVGKGCFFTSVDWVVRQCENKLGYAPFPGTLNVRVCDSDNHKLDHLFQNPDTELVSSDAEFCSAPVKKVRVSDIPAAVVLPAEDVRIHENNIVEIISGCSLKNTLGLKDGDTITISIPINNKESLG